MRETYIFPQYRRESREGLGLRIPLGEIKPNNNILLLIFLGDDFETQTLPTLPISKIEIFSCVTRYALQVKESSEEGFVLGRR